MDALHQPPSTSKSQQEQAVKTPNINLDAFKIPTRVKCTVPLRIAISNIEGAGKGVFVTQDLYHGDLVFSIPRPLSSIVDTGMLSSTCDNCFITAKNIAMSKSLISQREFMSCRKCQQIYYCTEKCQRVAWEHHHQFECETFGSPDLRTLWNRFCVNLPGRLRCVLRILCLRACGKIPKEWEELQSLQIVTNYDPKVRAKRSTEAKYFTDQILRGFNFRIPREEILHLVWLIADNERPIYAAEFKLFDSHKPWDICSSRPLVTARGIFMEPFTSLINHSCWPNVFYTFEGPEIQVRVAGRIKRGDEIRLSYITDTLEDFVSRQKMLQSSWGFTCRCFLCHHGDLTLKGPLREPVNKILVTRKFSRSDLAVLEELVGKVQTIHHEQGIYQAQTELYLLRKLAIKLCIKFKLYENALKHLLFIVLDTWQRDTTFGHSRWLRNFYRLLIVMDLAWETCNNSESRKVGSLTKDMIYFHLRAIYVRELGIQFGKTSAIAVFEGNEFEKLLDRLDIPYVSLAQRHETERHHFSDNILSLAFWAGLSAEFAIPGIEILIQVPLF